MKKIVFVMLTVCLLTIGSVNAQIFIMDEDQNSQRNPGDPGYGLFVPSQGSGDDQYVPVGSGSLLLIGFGAAYALLKRRKSDSER